MEEQQTDWKVPPFTASPQRRMGWIEEQIQEAEGWLAGQRAYKELPANLRVFDGIFNDKTKSTLVTNSLKYNVRKFVETLSEVREIALYGSDNPAYKTYAEMLNKVARGIYLSSNFPYQMVKVLQYATVMGVGYLWPKCHTPDYGFGAREIAFDALGLLDVLPVQVPSTNDVQDAYANTIFEYMPVAEAHGRFPLYQSQLAPIDHTGAYKSRLGARRVDMAEHFRYGDARNFGNLYCEIRYTIVRDKAINRTGQTLPMGEPGTSWYYEVPSLGSPILAGYRNGMPQTRPARAEDCLLYPTFRLLISARGMNEPMYDGPFFDWYGFSGKMPPVQYTVDDVAWEPLGRSLVGDVASIETTKRKLERKVDQVITVTLNPPMGYDRGSTGGPKIENFDIFEEDVRAGVDGKPRDVMQSLLPEEVRAGEVHFKMLEYLDQSEQKQLGLVDIGNLQNMKMNIAGDQADKMLESIGPLAKGIASRIEKGNKAVGQIVKYMIPQWLTTAQIMQYVPPAEVCPEVFDFDPDSIIPSHMPDELEDGLFPQRPSYYSKLQRARWWVQQLRVTSSPNTLLRVTQMQEQLKYLQLQRSGFPIPNCEVAKKLDIPNYGDVPGATLFEKWQNEQKIMLLFKAQMAQMMGQLAPPQPDQEQHGPGKGSAKAGGRPPSGQKPPAIKQKGAAGGAPRTTVTES